MEKEEVEKQKKAEKQKEREELRKIEPVAKILAANALSQSLSFCFERKYLEGIEYGDAFRLKAKPSLVGLAAPYWIKIEQVGHPLKDSAEECFTAIQKILTSCFLPNQTQLLFLLNSEDGVASLYLGIRSFNDDVVNNSFSENLNSFIQGTWPGLQSREVSSSELEFVGRKIAGKSGDKYRSVYTLTGIPSMESQYKTIYPATIDKLMAGMRHRNFSYLVIADPISESSIDSVLYQCREFGGRAESLKSFNFSESMGEGKSISDAHTKSIADGVAKGLSVGCSMGLTGNVGLQLAGAALAAVVCPAAAPLVAVAAGLSMSLGLSVNKSKSITHQESTSDTQQVGYSVNQSKTISQNMVNKQIEAVSEHLFYHSKRFETGKAIGCWNVGVYLLGEWETDLQSASLQLKSILSGQESVFEPIRVHDITDVVKPYQVTTLANFELLKIEVEANNNTFSHPLGDNFNELRTVLTTKELSYLINFPLRSVPGISVIDSTPEFSLNQQVLQSNEDITFGKLLYGGTETVMKYHIPVNMLSRHTLLSGINGSGKTNTVQAILNNLDVPFLIIEPAKTEYVDWAIEYNKLHPNNRIEIYMPGCKKYKGTLIPKDLKLNPFELVWLKSTQEPNVLSHIDRLKSTFAAAFPMYDILPVLMEDLIYTVYQNKSTDWLGKTPQFGTTIPPTLNGMRLSVDKVISNRQYEERIERNMKACFNTRIDSLKRGWKGEMLNTVYSTPWEELFNSPCIINLSYVGDDTDKSFFMALILQFLYEYRIAQAECKEIDFNDNKCKHLTVIEEAHRVMAKCENPELPQYKSAMMFSNMLSEIRAYGEGLFLVDQVPTRLIPDAIKNTNLKITHRLVAEDDCRAVSESMGLNDEQRKVIPKLLTGQCIVSSSLATDIYWIKVNKVK